MRTVGIGPDVLLIIFYHFDETSDSLYICLNNACRFRSAVVNSTVTRVTCVLIFVFNCVVAITYHFNDSL